MIGEFLEISDGLELLEGKRLRRDGLIVGSMLTRLQIPPLHIGVEK